MNSESFQITNWEKVITKIDEKKWKTKLPKFYTIDHHIRYKNYIVNNNIKIPLVSDINNPIYLYKTYRYKIVESNGDKVLLKAIAHDCYIEILKKDLK